MVSLQQSFSLRFLFSFMILISLEIIIIPNLFFITVASTPENVANKLDSIALKDIATATNSSNQTDNQTKNGHQQTQRELKKTKKFKFYS
jgi:hypothetical protein